MILPEFEYFEPKSLDEAGNLLKELGTSAKIMNGGTDLLVLMKDAVIAPESIVDIKNIPGLDAIEYEKGKGLRIGGLTKLLTIEKSELIKKEYPAIADAARYVASTQIRAKGTVAGNICNASPSADTAPILLVLNANVKTWGPEQSRTIPIGQFFKGVKQTVLEQGEIVTSIEIPPLGADERIAYIKFAFRKAMDLAIVGVAVWLKVNDNICVDARVALGAVATTPILAPKAAEALIGKELTDAVIAEAGIQAMESCKPISDVRASAEYRSDMIRVFTKRAIKKALGRN